MLMVKMKTTTTALKMATITVATTASAIATITIHSDNRLKQLTSLDSITVPIYNGLTHTID